MTKYLDLRAFNPYTYASVTGKEDGTADVRIFRSREEPGQGPIDRAPVQITKVMENEIKGYLLGAYGIPAEKIAIAQAEPDVSDVKFFKPVRLDAAPAAPAKRRPPLTHWNPRP